MLQCTPTILQVTYRHLLKKGDSTFVINALLKQEALAFELENVESDDQLVNPEITDTKESWMSLAYDSPDSLSSFLTTPGKAELPCEHHWTEYMCVSLNEHAIALDSSRVKSVERLSALVAQEYKKQTDIVGYVCWQDERVPVIDLTGTSHLAEQSPAEPSRIIIVDGNERYPLVGLVVSSVMSIFPLDTCSIAPALPSTAANLYQTSGVCYFGPQRHEISILDINGMLAYRLQGLSI